MDDRRKRVKKCAFQTKTNKSSLIKLFFKGYHGMLPSTLAEELVVHGDRPSSRLKHGLIAPSFTSKYVQNSISYRVAVLGNAIR